MLNIATGLAYTDSTQQEYSIELDGTGDFVTLGNVLNPGTADFTFSFWVKCADFTNARFISKYEDDNNQITIRCTGADKIIVKVNDSSTNVITKTAGSAITSLQNTWVHICLTCDRDDKANLYVNGATTLGFANYTAENSSTNLTNTGEWRFGRHGSNYMTGNIDEVAFWNVALDSDAVVSLYNGGIPFNPLDSNRGNYDNEANCVGHWGFGEGSGTTTADSRGNNAGTLSGDALFSEDTPDD